MNLANQITIARILLVPAFLVFMISIKEDWSLVVCAIIFIVAAATDGIDGYVARRYNMVTTFGKFIDPLADKLLVTAALIGLVELSGISSWIAVIIISREFIVTSIRIVAISEGKIIAASNWGKIKTVAQIVMIVILILSRIMFINSLLVDMVVYITVALTVYSGFDYFVQNIDMLEFK